MTAPDAAAGRPETVRDHYELLLGEDGYWKVTHIDTDRVVYESRSRAAAKVWMNVWLND